MAFREFADGDDHEYLSEGGHPDDANCNFGEDYVQCSSESSTDADDEIPVATEREDYTFLDLEQDTRQALRSSQRRSRARTSSV